MKKLLTTILITIISVMALTACSSGKNAEVEPDQPPVEIEVNDENNGDEAEDEEFSEGTYALSDLMFYDLDTGEWVTADFIPGAEKYVFHDDYTCEYIFKDYPSYEDMLADSNYEIVTKEGTYEFNSEESVISMTFDDMQASGTIDGDQLTIEFEDHGISAVRSIYTLEG